MSAIRFNTKLLKINSWIIVLLPESVSVKLPSRGMTMIKGTINGFPFKTVLEPDGRGSHWFRIDVAMQKKAKASAGNTVAMEIETSKEWLESEIPADLKKVLDSAPKEKALWMDITSSARWDWIRWIRAVKTPETRKKHIEVAVSKLSKGMRRPCCFNRNLCFEPYVSHNWVLLEPTKAT